MVESALADALPSACPQCGAVRFVKNGKLAPKLQRYRCVSCRKQFTARTGTFEDGMRFPKQAIIGAAALKFLGKASYANICVLLQLFLGVKVKSKQTAWEWVVKCEKAFDLVHKSYKKSYGRREWRIDEVFCRVKGSTSEKGYAYITVVSDNHGNMLGIHVGFERDSEAAEKVLVTITDPETRSPKFVVTDEWKAYPEVLKFNLPHARHVQTGIKPKRVQRKGKRYQFSVNKHERVNGDLQAWLYPMRGFKSLQAANTLCTMYRMHYTAGKQIGYQEFWERMSMIW